MAVRQQQRRGTAAQWAGANPILSAAEIGFEIDTNKFKIGDGINRWVDLAYFTTDSSVAVAQEVETAINNLINGAPGTLDTLKELADAIGNDGDFIGTLTSDLELKAPINSPTFTGTVAGITKSMVGLSNVDNTSDANKPISTATQSALDLKANSADITELSQDAVNTALTAGTGITKTYNDSANTITVAVDSTIATKTYADGKASDAQSAAQSFATSADSTLHTTITGEIATAKSQAVSTAEGYTDTAITNLVNGAPAVLDTLKELSDALGADKNFATTIANNIATAKSDAEGYTDSAISTEITSRNSAIATAKSQAIAAAETYADSLASNYDAAGSATTAKTDAKSYADGLISTEITNRNTAIATAKSDAEAYTDSAISGLINAAPSTLDTLKEIADALLADEGTASTLATVVGTKAPLNNPTFTGTVSGITKTMVGLGNVDNTTDANKPVSTATQTALDLKSPLASPAFTGNPTAPTQTVGDDSTKVATTAFVKAAIQNITSLNLVLDGGGV